MRKTLTLLPLAVLLFRSVAFTGDQSLKVHEWGTFTSLQDENGNAIGGINTDDEPVPKFVHELKGQVLLGPIQLPRCRIKGAPACHPDVTMRLETPVIYFHPPPSSKEPFTTDVEVAFRGGWLTEFYPAAEASGPGIKEQKLEFGSLTGETTGTLAWSGLEVGVDKPGPDTRESVWLSPRAVDAASVSTPQGEGEKFLFYRGVGHRDAPLSVSRDPKGDRLIIRGQIQRQPIDGRVLARETAAPPLLVSALWLVDVRSGGRAAFRALDPIELSDDPKRVLTTTRASFTPEEYSRESLTKLREAMHTALVEDGLFSDEADALLNTWKLSYFESTGLRLFFLVPRQWTDDVLPLHISSPAKIVRVMIGRIEIVTPAQRALLTEIAQKPISDRDEWWPKLSGREEQLKLWRDIENGNLPADALRSQGIEIPEDYRRYIELGRFRNALVLEEAARNPAGGMRKFIKAYGLESRASR